MNKTSRMMNGVLDLGGVDCRSRAPIAMLKKILSVRSGYRGQLWEIRTKAN